VNVVKLADRTYTAKLFEVEGFKIAGTLDGFVDLATPNGPTFQISRDTALMLAAELMACVADINKNYLFDRDALLERE
jgi:hypothetical protein